MSKHVFDSEQVEAYVNDAAFRPHPALASLASVTAELPAARMMTSPSQARFLGFLLQTLGASRAIEVGTFTGYGSLSMALALSEHGHLDTCDIDPKTAEIGRPFWKEAGVEGRIRLHVGPALESLKKFEAGIYDLAYIDADKAGYDAYYEQCLRLVRSGGLVCLDNMLWSGRVANPAEQDPQTVILRDLTKKILEDPRVDACLLPIADGLLMARVR